MPPRRLAMAVLAVSLPICCAGAPPAPDRRGTAAAGPTSEPPPAAALRLSRALLTESLQLGRQYLLNAQKPDGSFRYEYDFVRRTEARGQSAVRQAGALWGVATVHLDHPTRQTATALARGIAFFTRNSGHTEEGGQYVVYPGTFQGDTGTVALLALALVETIRAGGEGPAREQLMDQLHAYVEFLLSMRMPGGHFHAHYSHQTGVGIGGSSPYYDGETLLALIKAAKYAGVEGLRPVILDSAQAMYTTYVTDALRRELDSNTTKGHYQWGTMAWYELYTSGWPGTKVYAGRAIDLAYWMIDVHRTLRRRRNTAYAHEGLVSAWELARLSGDARAQKKIGRVIDEGLAKLTSWQVGHSLANAFLRASVTDDPRAVGGVMNGAGDPVLRIDVTQHQMHAVILARRFIYRAAE